jgi:hypothetical protein
LLDAHGDYGPMRVCEDGSCAVAHCPFCFEVVSATEGCEHPIDVLAIARYAAAQYWSPPDDTDKLAAGVYVFNTPTHGGYVAVLDAATGLSSEARAWAQQHRVIDRVAVQRDHRRRRRFLLASSCEPGVWRELERRSLEERDPDIESHDVWVAEEDSEAGMLEAWLNGTFKEEYSDDEVEYGEEDEDLSDGPDSGTKPR